MTPLPLRAPDGTVYAYACGACHRVAACFDSSHGEPPEPDDLEHNLRHATQCCLCERCGVSVVPRRTSAGAICEACQPIEKAECDARLEETGQDWGRIDQLVEASLTKSTNRGQALKLRAAISDVSEEWFGANWLVGIEHMLQRAIDGENPEAFVAIDLPRFETLGRNAGGWWHWPATSPAALFIPADEWRALHAAHVAKTRGPLDGARSQLLATLAERSRQ